MISAIIRIIHNRVFFIQITFFTLSSRFSLLWMNGSLMGVCLSFFHNSVRYCNFWCKWRSSSWMHLCVWLLNIILLLFEWVIGLFSYVGNEPKQSSCSKFWYQPNKLDTLLISLIGFNNVQCSWEIEVRQESWFLSDVVNGMPRRLQKTMHWLGKFFLENSEFSVFQEQSISIANSSETKTVFF